MEVVLKRCIFSNRIKEVNVPEGVVKEYISDYQDNYNSTYIKYYYISKKRK